MSKMIPDSKPQQARNATQAILTKYGVKDKVALVGVRGYYLNSMGSKGDNNRNVYDDAVFLISPTAYVAFNANVDPSFGRKGMANLMDGVHRYRIGIHGLSKPKHKQYKALRPVGPLKVWRDGEGESTSAVINIHRGSLTTTASEGCQTIPVSQWASFIAIVEGEMIRHDQHVIPYVLTHNEAMRTALV